MRKLLVTGASGFLGWNICAIAKTSWDVFGTVFSHQIDIPECNAVYIDLTDYKKLKNIFNEIKPDAVIHAAAVAQPDSCEHDPTTTHHINVDAAVKLAGLCADTYIPFVFTSSDLVFDGEHPPYSEKDSASPVNKYGEQKVKAEEGIRDLYPLAAICRMPLMFGDPSPASHSFLQPIYLSLQNNTPLNLFTDQIRTPACAYSAAQGLLCAIEKFTGIIHLGGKEQISRYEFAIKVAEYCGLSTSSVKPVLQKETTMSVPRPLDVSLDSSMAYTMGYSPLPMIDEFDRLNCLYK